MNLTANCTLPTPCPSQALTAAPRPAAMMSSRRFGALNAGFSLVEVMVAMVIGLLGIVVMMQMFSVFEGQKRTTTGGDDAISSGAIALYGVQRAVAQSGWGISSQGGDHEVSVLGCTVKPDPAFATDFGTTYPMLPLVPLTINSGLITGQDPNTDTLLLVSGTSTGSVEGDELPAGLLTPATPTAFRDADRVVSVPSSGACTGRKLGVYTASTKSATVDVDGLKVRVYNLGPAPTVRGYAIHRGNLTVCDFTAADCSAACTIADGPAGTTVGGSCNANWVSISSNIVSLRAQYGRDTNAVEMDGVIDQWDQSVTATPVSSTPLKDTLACAWMRIPVIRVALVARSSQPERLLESGHHATELAAALPTWAGSATAPISPPNPESGATWPTWQDYRYKVFQTVVPLRNVNSTGLSATVVPKC